VSEEIVVVPEPLWPRCSRCRKTAQPGVACDREICPFRRVNGVIGWE
jgi:hypothetical protein